MAEEIKAFDLDKPAPEYTPLPTFAPEEPKKDTYSNDKDGLEAAASELSEARKNGQVPATEDTVENTIDRGYRWEQGLGKEVEPHYTLDARRAAEDLTRVRQAEVEAASPPQEVTQAIDAVRDAFHNPQAQHDPQVQAQAAETQQQSQPQPADGVDPELRAALENPKIRQALEAEVAQVEQARQVYATQSRQAAQISAASLLANFPELANVPTNQLQTAISVIAATNPQRAQAIQGHLQRTEALYNASVRAQQDQQQLQAQVQAQRVAEFVKSENEKFERDVIAKETPETLQRIKDNIFEIAQESYGLSKEDLAHAWQTQPVLRSAAFQAVFLDAAKFRLAQREAAAKLDRSVPPVMRPGVSQPHSGNDGVTHALNRFKSDPSVSNASKLLLARRAATRR